MKDENAHFLVNWVDGMKITKDHFVATESHFIHQLNFSAQFQLTDYNFGLHPRKTHPLKLEANPERVEIIECHALTPNGFPIHISNQQFEQLRKPMDELLGEYILDKENKDAELDWYVVIKVNPYIRIPFGSPSPEEQPIRYPQVVPDYQLDIVLADQIQVNRDTSFIPLAKFKSSLAGRTRINEYIPPCACLESSQELMEHFRDFQKLNQDLLRELREVIKNSKSQQKSENKNEIAEELFILSSSIHTYYAHFRDQHRLMSPSSPPIFFVLFYVSLARLIQDELDLFVRGENLNAYFTKFFSSEFSAFEQSLSVKDLIYNHIDIVENLKEIRHFLEASKSLFGRLSGANQKYLLQTQEETTHKGAGKGAFGELMNGSTKRKKFTFWPWKNQQ